MILPTNKECVYCYRQNLDTKSNFVRHTIRCLNDQFGGADDERRRLPTLPTHSPFRLSRKAFRSYLQMYEVTPDVAYNNVQLFFADFHDSIRELINLLIDKLTALKLQACLGATFRRQVDNTITYTIGYFTTQNLIVTGANEIDDNINSIANQFEREVHQFESMGSGYILHEIDRLDIRIGQYNLLQVGCFQELPRVLLNKKCLVNIKSNDNHCFLWCVIAAIFPQRHHKERVDNYRIYENLFDCQGMTFPVSEKHITLFEDNNRSVHDIAINLFSYNANDTKVCLIWPYRISKNFRAKNIINLLILEDHFFLITKFNRLVNQFGYDKRHFCYACFSGFQKLTALVKHKERCQKLSPTIVTLPTADDKKLCFKAFDKSKKVPYVIYGDFECLLQRTNEKISTKSVIYQQHIPISYCLLVVKDESQVFYLNQYRGVDCMDKFFDDLKSIERRVLAIINEKKRMSPLTQIELNAYNNATTCHLCNKPFLNNRNRKIRDHSHVDGKFIGAAHSLCNIRSIQSRRIPLFFHNSKNYDCHLIIKYLNVNIFEKCELIPRNTEQILAFTLDQIQVLDTLQFMPESLSQLVENLRNANYEFPITTNVFKARIGNNNEKRLLLFKKSSFPYDWFSSADKFDFPHLPEKSEFKSILTDTDITEEDYQHAIKVFEKFEMKSFADYHDFYLLLDVCLLADAFQQFRKLIYTTYQLEPCLFYGVPSLAWTACMKYTQYELDLLTDIDMYNFLESSIRGGFASVTKRYTKANNKYLNDYNPEEKNIFLILLDVVNLYGWSMSNLLPESQFEWLKTNECGTIDWSLIDTQGEFGYILEVDIQCDESLHDLHNDFPLALHNSKIPDSELSAFQKTILDQLMSFSGYKRIATEKLMGTFYEHKNYVVHFKNLKFYLTHGLTVSKIHRVLKFRQSDYLLKYINRNAELRKQAKNTFEKNLYKLLNNVIFGKSIERVRERVIMKLCLSVRQARKYLIKPNFQSFIILDENKSLIQMRNQHVKLNRPIFLGFACLELSKLLMYEAYYDKFKPHYGDRISINYMDTDSFLLEIETEDIYEDLKEYFHDTMDMSVYPVTSPFHDVTNFKVIGKFADELPNTYIREFIGLKPKLYSILFDDNQCKNTAKGLQRSVLKNSVTHDDYRNVLFERAVISHDVRRIQSRHQTLSTVKTRKTVFTPLCDKRYYLNDGIRSLAFGHKRIRELST